MKPAGRKLQGRIAIVTGGTRGIGYAISKRLAKDGAHVVVSSRKLENVERAMKDINALGFEAVGIVCDMENQEDRKNLFERTVSELGNIDIFVQNAGASADRESNAGHFRGKSRESDRNIRINFQAVQEIVPYMTRCQNQGTIVLTSSAGGYISQVLPGSYSVSKTAIFSMVRAFMADLIRHNIRINCLTYGEFNDDFLYDEKSSDRMREQALGLVPTRTFGGYEECAHLASFLCSDDARKVSGESYITAADGYIKP